LEPLPAFSAPETEEGAAIPAAFVVIIVMAAYVRVLLGKAAVWQYRVAEL
jgi:hypothetical protein